MTATAAHPASPPAPSPGPSPAPSPALASGPPSAAPACSLEAGERLLVLRFSARHEVLSWAIWNGGRTRAPAVAWVAVSNAELPLGGDPRALCAERLAAADLAGAVGLLTSGRLARHRQAQVAGDGLEVLALATVGLSNAVRVGDPPGPLAPIGTINLVCRVSQPLSEEAALEALAIAVEARTAAVLEARYRSRRSSGLATGTGTDCVVLAWPESAPGAPRAAFAGKHTLLGALVGQAVGQVVAAGASEWLEEHACLPG